jgi:ketosteroid isomerase-like protein
LDYNTFVGQLQYSLAISCSEICRQTCCLSQIRDTPESVGVVYRHVGRVDLFAIKLLGDFTMKRGLMAVLALVVLGREAAAAPRKEAAARKDFQAAYAKLGTAMKQKNLSALLKFYTPDYTRQESNGHIMNHARFKVAMQNVLRSQQTVRGVNFHIDSLRVTGNTAIVTTTVLLKAHVTYMDRQEQPVPSKAYEMTATWPMQDYWVKTAAGWRIKSSKMLAPTKATLEARQPSPLPGSLPKRENRRALTRP